MTAGERRLLYIDMAYTVDSVRQRQHGHFFDARHSNGYFRRVWGVHPLADIAGKNSHAIETISWSEDQTIIEGVAESLPLPRVLLPANFLWSQGRLLARLKRLILDECIDVISTSDPYYSGLVGLALKKLTGRPLIVSVFGNYDELHAATGALAMPRLFRFHAVERRVARMVLSRADLVITQNDNNMAAAKANGARGRTVIIPAAKHVGPIHLVAPQKRGAPAILRKLGVDAGAPLLIYVGRFLALKHPDDAVRAMAEVIRQRPDSRGLLAGAGPMQSELEALIDELGMTGRIQLTGQLDQDELSRLLPHCITLSPLTGMALTESALAGSPMVVFDRDWQADFVEDELNGYVVPFRDHRAMADRTLKIITNDAARRRMGRAARGRALEYADPDRIYTIEHSELDQLLGCAPR